MGDWTYNTDHGVFFMAVAKVPLAFAALQSWIKEKSECGSFAFVEEDATEAGTKPDFEALMEFLGFGLYMNDRGDIHDIFLNVSDFGETKEEILTKVIAPFVDDGSFLVFYGGGANGCWTVVFDKNRETDKVEGRMGDVECVVENDLRNMLDAIRINAPNVYRDLDLEKKYGWRFTNRKAPDGGA